jgi:predicted nucleic acid-binding protein
MMVIDANVVVKWFVPEDGSREAVALQAGPHNLVAPTLICMEVAGGICRATREDKPRLTKTEAEDSLVRWFRMVRERVVEIVPDESLLKEASALSLSIGHPLADCFYLELSHRMNLPLITADKVFHDRVIERFPKVRLLKKTKM